MNSTNGRAVVVYKRRLMVRLLIFFGLNLVRLNLPIMRLF